MNIQRLPQLPPQPEMPAKPEAAAGPQTGSASATPAASAPSNPPQSPVSADQAAPSPANGVALPVISLGAESDCLNVENHKNGKIQVSGFPAGNPPPLDEILKSAFPDAKEIKVLGSDHSRPFDTHFIEVDGKPFTASFLYGGFAPSSQYNIVPGHQHGLSLPDAPVSGSKVKKPSPVPPAPAEAAKAVELSVERSKNGGIVVKGFPPGNPPPVETILKAAFPDAKEIQVTSSSHQRPFDTYQVLVDGKPFTANFLYGGFMASDQYGIRPGHDPSH